MSSLLHPLHGAREKCRPKHQVLVLRCYPKYQKNVQDVKPNSSELSYLLYYATTRRSKLQKVGAFLEKKTASDVWRQRLGNVQVTLQILTSIIEKAPRDLSLYAGSVLTILDTIIRSKDINMVEESVPTFEAYCKHVDPASLDADQARAKQYHGIIEQYSSFASEAPGSNAKTNSSVPTTLRWRTISLRVIRAVVGSDALATNSLSQLNVVMPVILQNLNLSSQGGLGSLQQRASTGEKVSIEIARKRRLSTATVANVDDTTTNAQPAMASETTADADQAAEEEVRILAVRCLRQIFTVSTGSSRAQLRLATALTLRFIASNSQSVSEKKSGSKTGRSVEWSVNLFEAIARWTPTQDRFIVVLTATETLIRTPIVESVLDKQLVLANLIDWLLRSDINLIGLSVMDILLGLIQHVLLLLQLGGRDSKVTSYAQNTDALGLYKDTQHAFDVGTVLGVEERGRQPNTRETEPSATRIELLSVLQRCISDLATHIYYTDQISDMMTAILARLKPSAQSDVTSTAAAINDPAAATRAIVDTASLQEDPSTDNFFSFATARVTALKAIRQILITANSRRTSAGVSAEVRSRVGVQVWDGTQWLLKDEAADVRMAYVDAILTWVRLETNSSDLLLPKDTVKTSRSARHGDVANGDAKLTRRAVSSASRKESKPAKSTFLQLLHLAVYDDALDRAENEIDILLLYLMLSTLVERLGVNAIRTGLPMVFKLQETGLNTDNGLSARGKAHIACLVHAYLWTVAEKFDFESSPIGHEINAEISRRKKFGLWLDKIKYPPMTVSQIETATLTGVKRQKPEVSHEMAGSIRPFLNIQLFVEEIANAYNSSLISPPQSPALTPSARVFSVPTLGFGYGYSVTPAARPSLKDQLSQKVKDEMCGSWSRESCIAAVDKETASSIAGSRTGNSSGKHNRLTVTTSHETASGQDTPNQGPDSATAAPAAFGAFSGLGSLSKHRNFSAASSLRDMPDTSSRDSATMKMADMKRALSGANGNSVFRHDSPLRRPVSRSRQSQQSGSSGSESMVSWNPVDDPNGSALDIALPGGEDAEAYERPETASSAVPASSLAAKGDDTGVPNSRFGDDVPPVPKIPSTLNLPGTWPRDVSPGRSDVVETHHADPTLDNSNNPNATFHDKATLPSVVSPSHNDTDTNTVVSASSPPPPPSATTTTTSATADSTAAGPSPRPRPAGTNTVAGSGTGYNSMGGAKRTSRPASRAGAASVWSDKHSTSGGYGSGAGVGRRRDLKHLLAGISLDNDNDDGRDPTSTTSTTNTTSIGNLNGFGRAGGLGRSKGVVDADSKDSVGGGGVGIGGVGMLPKIRMIKPPY